MEVQINLVKLGKAKILTIPGGALTNIELCLKGQMKREHHLLCRTANDSFGYILIKVDFKIIPPTSACPGVVGGEADYRQGREAKE